MLIRSANQGLTRHFSAENCYDSCVNWNGPWCNSAPGDC